MVIGIIRFAHGEETNLIHLFSSRSYVTGIASPANDSVSRRTVPGPVAIEVQKPRAGRLTEHSDLVEPGAIPIPNNRYVTGIGPQPMTASAGGPSQALLPLRSKTTCRSTDDTLRSSWAGAIPIPNNRYVTGIAPPANDSVSRRTVPGPVAIEVQKPRAGRLTEHSDLREPVPFQSPTTGTSLGLPPQPMTASTPEPSQALLPLRSSNHVPVD